MSWRVSYQIGMSELGANALFPTGGAGGLALGAWALKRGGMPASEIARRTAAFFLLTSVANVVGVIVVGIGLAVRVFPGETNLALTLLSRRDRHHRQSWRRCWPDAHPHGYTCVWNAAKQASPPVARGWRRRPWSRSPTVSMKRSRSYVRATHG